MDTEQPKGEGGFVLVLDILQLVRNQAAAPAGERMLHPLSQCYQSHGLRLPSLPAALVQAPFHSPPSLSPRQLYNVGVGWRSWESGIPCSPRSSQGNSSLVVSSLGPPWLLWGRGRKDVLEKPLD